MSRPANVAKIKTSEIGGFLLCRDADHRCAFGAQFAPCLIDDLPSAPQAKSADDRRNDHIRPSRAGAENPHCGEQDGGIADSIIAGDIHTERMFASPVRKR